MNKNLLQEYKNNGSLEPGTRIEIDWNGSEKGLYTGRIISSDRDYIVLNYSTGVGNFNYEYILTIAPPVRKDGFKK